MERRREDSLIWGKRILHSYRFFCMLVAKPGKVPLTSPALEIYMPIKTEMSCKKSI